MSPKETSILLNMSKNLHISFAAVTHLDQGVCLNALLMLKVDNSVTHLLDTRMPTLSTIEWQFMLNIMLK